MKHLQSTTRPLPAKAACNTTLFADDKTLADSACLFGDSSDFVGLLKLLFRTFR